MHELIFFLYFTGSNTSSASFSKTDEDFLFAFGESIGLFDKNTNILDGFDSTSSMETPPTPTSLVSPQRGDSDQEVFSLFNKLFGFK